MFTQDEELPFHELPWREQGKAAFLHNHCVGQLTGSDPQFIPAHRTNLTGYSLPHCSDLLRGFWQSCINLLDYIWLYRWLCLAKVENDSAGGMTDKIQWSSPSELPAKQKILGCNYQPNKYTVIFIIQHITSAEVLLAQTGLKLTNFNHMNLFAHNSYDASQPIQSNHCIPSW